MLLYLYLSGDFKQALTIRGGGRKAKSADVEKEILDEIEKGNYHTRQQIADMIKDKFNITVTVTAVSRLLKKWIQKTEKRFSSC